MERCVADVRRWMAKNKLKLNDSKTECLVVTSKRAKKAPELTITIGDETIKPKVTVQNLGATLDSELSIEAHVRRVIKTSYFHLQRIAMIRNQLTTEACATILHATVTSRLDFHNGLLAGVAEKTLAKVQIVQNNTAHLLTKVGKRDHITPVLSQLHWLPLKQRIAYKILSQVHSALHSSSAPRYLCDQFTIYQPGRSLRSSSDQWSLVIPRARLQYGSRSLRVFGARLWNSLPLALRQPQTVLVFKKNLKTYLFKQAYC
jgi:hypothetical protein